ncbi:hypothetical protein Psal071_03497 (plasmid) [Piscirickettsia salmonis]|uniref:Uncharacterized protein n=1 Tax=Piscirickettsia salmonis TaxID=1238 RepID=A0A9Q6LHB0_PISSA|nr:hypothetical protein Psal006a_03526 [Piscirickettsia salmonis]QGO04562.1 hypothetical protein Psal009_00431 [Piscirickettsia salmonis]QGO35952.1 hypothetical protein Psal028_03335 [Piscirickettsia salmonis]QGO39576.1 hypothetical protein Psal040_03349 [Piscirickettsia salmonis]QGO46916.1 hypothetical protein Psal051_03505 [Piscirickettsia salmonis]
MRRVNLSELKNKENFEDRGYAHYIQTCYFEEQKCYVKLSYKKDSSTSLLLFEALNLLSLKILGFAIPSTIHLIQDHKSNKCIGYLTSEVILDKTLKFIDFAEDISRITLTRLILGDNAATEDGNILMTRSQLISIDVPCFRLAPELVPSKYQDHLELFSKVFSNKDLLSHVSENTINHFYNNIGLISYELSRLYLDNVIDKIEKDGYLKKLINNIASFYGLISILKEKEYPHEFLSDFEDKLYFANRLEYIQQLNAIVVEQGLAAEKDHVSENLFFDANEYLEDIDTSERLCCIAQKVINSGGLPTLLLH